MKRFYSYLNVIRLWPHLLCYAFSANRKIILTDMAAYRDEYNLREDGILLLLWLLTFNKSFRSLFYYRSGFIWHFISFLAMPETDFRISKDAEIGEGLLLFHAYGTILNCKKIGNHCRIVHNVTLGDKKGGVPTIGNRVEILPNAVVVGDINIGDDCVIGPGAVVYKSVPAKCVVVGNPAYILKRDGVVVNEKL